MAIPSRKKPVKTKREIKLAKKGKRGRPRKGEERPKKEMTQLEKQIDINGAKAISELNLSCAWGYKNMSRKSSSWKGYKLHLDITDFGIPVTAIITGANVHDSQLAIPMEKITNGKITFLYSLMDAAYDAQTILAFIQKQNRVPVIDPNKRKKTAREPFGAVQKQRYKIRTTVERTNAHLKDWLIPEHICVRGSKKFHFFDVCSSKSYCYKNIALLHSTGTTGCCLK